MMMTRERSARSQQRISNVHVSEKILVKSDCCFVALAVLVASVVNPAVSRVVFSSSIFCHLGPLENDRLTMSCKGIDIVFQKEYSVCIGDQDAGVSFEFREI